MRFDIFLAAINPGLYAPLGLMAGGFLLAVGGLIFLLWRRKKIAEPAYREQEVAQDDLAYAEPEMVAAGAPVTPAPAEGRRRRALVGVAEQENGTPSGEQISDDAEALEPETVAVEGQTQADYDIEPVEHDGGPMDDGELETDEIDIELEPEWVEPELDQPAELDDPEVTAEVVPTVEDPVATAPTAAAAAVMMDDGKDLPDFESEEDVDTVEDQVGGEESKAPIPADIAAAFKNPIVFRQFLPQSPGQDGLSFFGGQPIGPGDFQWPRERGAEGGNPLQFVMQWDCSQLSQQDPTGLLPQDGILYCFINSDQSDDEDFLSRHAFIHHRGATGTWEPVAIPDDAGPALGKAGAFEISGCSDAIDNAESFVPRTLPRFPFASVAFDYPHSEGDEGAFWSCDKAASALLEIQNSGASARKTTGKHEDAPQGFGRPFPSFPHDFGAVRVMATRMIESLQEPDDHLAQALFPNLSEDHRKTQSARWVEEAKELYSLGTQRPQGHKLEQNIADDVWQWFEERSGMLGDTTPALYEESVDLSLGVGSEAIGNIPADWIDKAMHSHALATHDGRGVRAPTPARMFGPPSNAGDEGEALASDHTLLLELPSGAGPQHHFGGNILQYWITPDDLAAGNFAAVKQLVVQP